MEVNRKHALCTLFNSVYMDKGIVLYESLAKVSCNFVLYVLCMDDKCFDVLSDLNFDNLVPIKLAEFENEELLVAKSNRPFGQYCWTCSSSLIKFVLDTYQPDFCTYIDADMAFYDDPITLIEELERKGAEVSFVGHRFSKYDSERERLAGHFCVECNTFSNTGKARQIMNEWIDMCLEDCSIKEDGVHWGDQKYLDVIFERYRDSIIETDLIGAGVAPWNIQQYRFELVDDSYYVSQKDKKERLLFYHFEKIVSPQSQTYNIGVFSKWGISKSSVYTLYIPYLQQIEHKKKLLLNNYGIDTTILHHPAVTPYPKENLIQRTKRIIKLLFTLDLSNWFYHSLPSHLYGKNDIINIKEF